jgi:large subunit ribosomal protein L18
MSINEKTKKIKNIKLRKLRTRKSIANKALPRLTVQRSLKHFYMQIIDDSAGKTVLGVNDLQLKFKKKGQELAAEVGTALAKKAIEKKIEKVVFDRGAYKYHGQVKAAAEAARKAGLKF